MKEDKISVYFITISAEKEGQRIDNFLRTHLKGIPKSMIYRIVRKGEVRVNKKRIKIQYKLHRGDKLRIPPVRQSKSKYEKLPICTSMRKVIALKDAIIYEDNHLLIINKPSGIMVHSNRKSNFGIIEALRALRPKAKFLELVHRLDRDTSGVLLIAKKRSALRALHEQLRIKGMQKDYLALVRGQWPLHNEVVAAPLLRKISMSGKPIVQVNSNGKMSETWFKVEERFTQATLVKASAITGRTHQIRVHVQYAGHPIAFDDRYGDLIFDQQLQGCGLNRIFLHASVLCFTHPENGELLRIEAPLDDALYKCLLYLRAQNKQ